jgi:two-component system, OmpR family, alkaline phosphatase synthesis response regulator PhoP
MLSVCVIEDESSIRGMIKMNLELEGFTVSTFEDGRIALENINTILENDLIILDVMLPHVSGLDICEAIRKFSEVPILFLSAKGTTADKIAGLKKGGTDYLAKPFELEELLLRVQILLNRSNPKKEQTTEHLTIGSKTINFNTFEVVDTVTGATVGLSKREIELLQLFYEKEGLVISRDEILDLIWGKDQFPTSRTIDNYILSFRKLFEKDPRNPQFFHSIRSVGYKFTLVES